MQASGRTRMGRDLERDSGCGAEVGRPEGRFRKQRGKDTPQAEGVCGA